MSVISNDGNKDVVEILDRIVGRNIHDASASDILDAFRAFASSSKSRAKILALLSKKVCENFVHYSAQEIIQILEIHSSPEHVDHDIFELSEEYLLNKLPNLDSEDLISLIKCFN